MENYQLASFALTFLKKFSGQERLPAVAVADENSDYCAICLNDICRGDSYRELSECGHSFHCTCIDAWLQSHSTCPLCRAQLPQMISLNQNHYDWNDVVANVLLFVQDFLHRMCNPLNDELSSILSGNVSCIA